MRLFIRTNFNKKIGFGHFSRCVRLASYFASRGIKSKIYLDKKNNLDNFFSEKKNFEIKNLYLNKDCFQNQSSDARLFMKKINKNTIVLVDDYRLDHRWEKLVSKKAYKILSIEDQNKVFHYSDYIVNSNPKYIDHSNYIKKNKKICSYLLGPKFSIINNEKLIKKKSNKKNITFYFGGAGNLIFYYKILNYIILNKKIPSNVNINIIVGPLCKNKELIYLLNKKNKHIKIYDNTNNLNEVLSKTDLLISSSGMISNEANYFNIPGLYFQVANNQKIKNKYLEKIGMYFNLQLTDLKKFKKVSELICLMFDNLEILKKTYKSTIKIDGFASKRIFQHLFKKKKITEKVIKLSKTLNKKKLVKLDDLAINKYLEARNLNINRINSFKQNKINTLDHYIWWMKSKKFINALVMNNEYQLFIKNEFTKYKGQTFCTNGFVLVNQNISGLDVIWALNKNIEEIKKKNKKICFMSIVKKDNRFANLHTKYIGLKFYQKNDARINKYLANKKINLSKFNIYIGN